MLSDTSVIPVEKAERLGKLDRVRSILKNGEIPGVRDYVIALHNIDRFGYHIEDPESDLKDHLEFCYRLKKYGLGMPSDFRELPLGRGQTGTISFPEQAKVAALLFDKIWVPPTSFQRDFGFDYGVDQPPVAIQFCSSKDIEALKSVGSIMLFSREVDTAVNVMIDKINQISCRYESESRFVRTLKCGNDLRDFEKQSLISGYRAVIKNVDVPVNKKLEWPQIMEVREDEDSLNKIRSMRLWLNEGLNFSTEEDATEKIGEKLLLYKETLKKHGIVTRNGVFASVFSGACSFANKPDESGLILGLTLMGGVALAVNKIRIDNEAELRKPGLREVAWLNEIHQQSFSERIEGWFRRSRS